ncbi:formate dehydrogenase accessory sulfurtransferase FdhD [Virgibacillus sp. NKC19-3]|uniref:formate dehydrogenase accessory sulfurtransferase FdhD n=1 Tax=Virgibacillus saliphilus TaxID=2831674 RepID=UPI001C9B4C51|nr:formate dehydrogenase accessory sulfurtransferase FdhD [Virgibacillus sp. NKC19-3]MBY7142071.1 formate dehydrogenase accessory sulfurtransferase FdhD [Virgibacillus sp. NKC19-3]
MNKTIHKEWEIVRFDGNTPFLEDEVIATESPLTVMLNGQEFATIVCSTTDLEDLLVGFLASEGVIRFYNDITSLSIDEALGFAHVELKKPLTIVQNDSSKRFIGSCCGKSRQFYFQSDVKTAKTVRSRLEITVDQCYSLMDQLQEKSIQFKETGGVHNAALGSVDEIVTMRTDIGRHNALDKIYGDILKNQRPLKDKVIIFSGRISSEVLLKVSKIGIGILLSKSAPTDLGLKLADDLGITTVGFVRNNKMNVYTHQERIIEANPYHNISTVGD